MSNMSSPFRVLQSDFRAGELDPNTRMRADTKLYQSGARSLLNTVIFNTGAATRRPGTSKLQKLAKRSWLVEYEFDEDEKYILAFQENQLEIFDENGNAVAAFSGAASCPWEAGAIWALSITGFANTVYIANQGFRTKVLKRTGLTSFSMTDFSFYQPVNGDSIYQPYFKFEPNNVMIKIDNPTTVGPGHTVTANQPIFSPEWVGDTIRIYGKEIDITAYVSPTEVTGTTYRWIVKSLDPQPIRTTSGSQTVVLTWVKHGLATGNTFYIEGAQSTGGLSDGSLNGDFTATYRSRNEILYTASGGGSATSSLDGGGVSVFVAHEYFTEEWDEQAFSSRRGWPQAICIHQNRLWMGGSTELPDGMFGSVVGNFEDFDVGEGEDDSSVQFTIASDTFTKIRHIESSGKLLIFSDSAEFVLDQREGEPITPGNAAVRAQTHYGSSYVQPLFFDGAKIFIQRNKQAVREYLYDFASDNYVSNDITAAANHLIDNPYDFSMIHGTSKRPEQYAFFINEGGSIAMFHSIRQEQLASWVPWKTVVNDGFDSVCALGNKVFASVYRNTPDGPEYWLEQIEFDKKTITLDGALEGTNETPTNVWSMGASYRGEVIDVVSNGNYLGLYEVQEDGTVTLDYAVDHFIGGWDYSMEIIPNAPDAPMRDGAMTGTKRRVNAVVTHFRETTSANVNSYRVVARKVNQDLSISPTPFNGKKKTSLLGYSRDPVFVITQDEPLYCTVLGVVMEVSV